MGLFGSKTKPGDATPAPMAKYQVIYKGGLAHLSKAKAGGIEFQVWDDHFAFEPTIGSKKWWDPLTIPFAAVSDVQIVRRQVSSGQALLAGGNTRDLATDNNLNFHYVDPAGQPLILRMEMMTGVTVTGQAKRAAEFADLLMAHGIRAQFHSAAAPAQQPPAQGGVTEHLAKLGEMYQQGLLTQAEFEAAKAKALGL